MVGMFINTLPLRVLLPGAMPVAEWLQDLQERQGRLVPYSHTPLVQIQQQTTVPAGQPLFESILVFENYPVDDSLKRSPAGLQIADLKGTEQTNYPLAVYVVPGQALTLRIAYDRRRIEPGACSADAGAFAYDPAWHAESARSTAGRDSHLATR